MMYWKAKSDATIGRSDSHSRSLWKAVRIPIAFLGKGRVRYMQLVETMLADANPCRKGGTEQIIVPEGHVRPRHETLHRRRERAENPVILAEYCCVERYPRWLSRIRWTPV